MQAEPQKEHAWLLQLIGEWQYEGECTPGPDHPPMKTGGSETARGIGPLWLQIEQQGPMPDGQPMTAIITLGYDPQKQAFVGTFIASMMSMIWEYVGQLDASGKVLTLDSRGPSMAGDGGLADYQDIIAIVSPDHWRFSSQIRGEDGRWIEFMSSDHRRVK